MHNQGLEGMRLLSHEYDKHSFGNAVAVFQCGSLIFRFVGDRGQDFLEMASIIFPDRYYQFDDIDCAMGWKTLDEVLSKQEPEPLEDLLYRVNMNLSLLEQSFSKERVDTTISILELRVKERRDAVLRKFNTKKGSNKGKITVSGLCVRHGQ